MLKSQTLFDDSRLMGLRVEDPKVQRDIKQLLLKITEKHPGSEVRPMALIMPPNCNVAQQQSTEDAGVTNVFGVMRIINEPTGAAIAYGHGEKPGKDFPVYNLGGGTIEVSLLKIDHRIFVPVFYLDRQREKQRERGVMPKVQKDIKLSAYGRDDKFEGILPFTILEVAIGALTCRSWTCMGTVVSPLTQLRKS